MATDRIVQEIAQRNERLAREFWASEDGTAVAAGGRLDRYLPHFLLAGREPHIEITSDEDARAFYEDGAYYAIRDAALAAWPKGRCAMTPERLCPWCYEQVAADTFRAHEQACRIELVVCGGCGAQSVRHGERCCVVCGAELRGGR